VATDGHRLHEYRLIDPIGIETGLYSFFQVKEKLILIQEKSSIEEYPNYNGTFPKQDGGKKFVLSCPGKFSEFGSSVLCKFLKHTQEDEGINIEYLRDILSIGDWDVTYFGDASPVVFEAKDEDTKSYLRRGMIMPMRI